MKKITLLIFLTLAQVSHAQVGVNSPVKPSKWRVGGNVGLNFGSDDYFGMSIMPVLAYEFTPFMEGGVSVGYQYSGWKLSKQNLFNAGPFVNFYPISSLFVRTHYEFYSGTTKYKDTGEKHSFDEQALWVGGGFRTPGPVSFHAGIMYDVLNRDRSKIYKNGIRPIAGVSIQL